jgi:hypothetical protein
MLYAERRILEIRFAKSRVIIKRNFVLHKILTQKKEKIKIHIKIT